ncbi:MAG: hypothetical protein J6333_09725 [Planctomycetes bacterium]|nr:hypothetical protein [Planctomycetota bacterium]
MTSEFIAAPLAHTFVFGVIVACGGGLAGRGRVSLAALACAALAVPMCDCALWWLNLAILEPPIIAIGAAAFWWRRRQRPAGTIGGVVGAAMAATMLDFGLRGFDLSNAHWLRGAVWLIVAGATVFFWWLGRERPAPIDC